VGELESARLMYGGLADVLVEVKWLANITNPKMRRA
jgi:hypothetical protein